MKAKRFVSVVFLVMVMFTLTMVCEGASCYVPVGSYQKTCRNIKVTLTCEAQKINQTWVPASFDLTNASKVDLANMDGVLQNQGTALPFCFVPAGSYQKTCRNIKVTLKCEAQKINQTWVPASFDLTNVCCNVDLANMDGVLENQGTPKCFVPAGSYQKTCKDIEVKLTCQAQKINQSWVSANFDLTNVCNVDLANMDGVLQNQGTAVPNCYLPAGSYKKTCSDIKVTLSCKAQKINGTWVTATFDLTNCCCPLNLANIDGVLKPE